MKAKVILNGLKIVNAQGAFVSLTLSNGQFEWENSEMSQKDKQYANYLLKFFRDWATNHMPKNLSWAKKVDRFVKVVNGLNSENFRHLSNNLRRVFDDGKVLDHETFQGKFFYEGKMNVASAA